MVDTITPEVLWAQRSNATEPEKNIIYLTISALDVDKSSAKLDIKPTSISFVGTSSTKHVQYKVDMELYGEIDVENSKSHHSPRGVDMVLRKKEVKEEFWPRLLKEPKRLHFIKTDFDKWVDEDEQEGVEDDYSNMGGMGDGDGLGGIDFSKLGGQGGMPDLSGMDMSALQAAAGGAGAGEGDEDDEDDDDMPELEEEGKGKAADSSKAKIEEVS